MRFRTLNAKSREIRAEARFSAELDQAWEHHRHLADKGQKYMDRFMALVGASAAFAAALFDKKIDVAALSLLAVVLFVVFLLCLSITRSIAANARVLLAYDDFFKKAMDYYYSKQNQVPRIWELRQNIPVRLALGPFTSADFEILVLYFILYLFPISFALMAHVMQAMPGNSTHHFLPAALAIVSVSAWALAFIRLCHAKRKQLAPSVK